MANNIVYPNDDRLPLDVSGVNGSGTGDAIQSGDPGVKGVLAFVAITDEDADSIATVQTRGTARLSVRGHDGTADAAVAVGDQLYWDNTNGEIDVATGGAEFGVAVEAVASGATTEILVRIGK